MPTTNDVDEAGAFYGPMDINGKTASIARWQSDTFEGRPIAPGRWYHLVADDGVTSFGMIQAVSSEFYAFKPYQVGNGLGLVAGSLDEAIRMLV